MCRKICFEEQLSCCKKKWLATEGHIKWLIDTGLKMLRCACSVRLQLQLQLQIGTRWGHDNLSQYNLIYRHVSEMVGSGEVTTTSPSPDQLDYIITHCVSRIRAWFSKIFESLNPFFKCKLVLASLVPGPQVVPQCSTPE